MNSRNSIPLGHDDEAIPHVSVVHSAIEASSYKLACRAAGECSNSCAFLRLLALLSDLNCGLDLRMRPLVTGLPLDGKEKVRDRRTGALNGLHVGHTWDEIGFPLGADVQHPRTQRYFEVGRGRL